MKSKTWRENQEEIAFIIYIYFNMEKIFAFKTLLDPDARIIFVLIFVIIIEMRLYFLFLYKFFFINNLLFFWTCI